MIIHTIIGKTILAAVVVFSHPSGVNLQQVHGVFVLTLAQCLQMICRPYRSDFDILSEMDSASILFLSLASISSICFENERISRTVRIMVAPVVVVSVCNIVLLFCFLGFFSIFAVGYFKIVLAIKRRS